jgi:hydroxymethylglutaryl-CoA reductase
MAIEESLLLPPSKSANYWSTRGGFKATVIDTEKIGQVHFLYKGDVSKLSCFLFKIKQKFF